MEGIVRVDAGALKKGDRVRYWTKGPMMKRYTEFVATFDHKDEDREDVYWVVSDHLAWPTSLNARQFIEVLESTPEPAA